MTINLANAKAQLNLVTDDDDTLVMRLIQAAQDWLENALGYKLATQYPNAQDGSSTLPYGLEHAVYLMTGHYYANREASLIGGTGGELPLGVCDIVNDYRNWSWCE